MRDVTNDSDGSSRLLSNAGFPAIDFFSLDVEGAEEKVLRTAKLANFKMIMHEVSMPLSAKDTYACDDDALQQRLQARTGPRVE
tara:strand:+ start:141 stop:392 length:252 start_codon:yes stop_codon:yes gene_type:complete